MPCRSQIMERRLWTTDLTLNSILLLPPCCRILGQLHHHRFQPCLMKLCQFSHFCGEKTSTFWGFWGGTLTFTHPLSFNHWQPHTHSHLHTHTRTYLLYCFAPSWYLLSSPKTDFLPTHTQSLVILVHHTHTHTHFLSLSHSCMHTHFLTQHS